jgi:hypothetical protein
MQEVEFQPVDPFRGIDIPDGLTGEDVIRAAHLIQEWADDQGRDGDYCGLALVVRVYRVLSAAAARPGTA